MEEDVQLLVYQKAEFTSKESVWKASNLERKVLVWPFPCYANSLCIETLFLCKVLPGDRSTHVCVNLDHKYMEMSHHKSTHSSI